MGNDEKDIKKIIDNGKDILVDKWMSEDDFNTIFQKEDIQNCLKLCTSPADEDIFNAFSLFPLEKTKVLILGQDPYPSGKGTGFAFLLNKKVEKDDSLYYILKAIKGSEFLPKNITEKEVKQQYKEWVKTNKVLLLNTALTYKRGYKTEHQNAWKEFIRQVIKTLLTTDNNKLVVFLWGDDARVLFHKIIFEEQLNSTNRVLVLSTSHPSKNYNAHKKGFDYEAPNHFNICNAFLGSKNEVKWGELLSIYCEVKGS